MMKLQSKVALEKAVSTIDKYYQPVYITLFILYYYTQVTVLSGAPFFFVEFFKSIISMVLPAVVTIWLVRNISIGKKEAVIGLFFAAVLMIISIYNGYAEVKYLGLLAAGSIGVDLKKVIKCTGIIAFTTVIYTFLYAFAVNPSINNVYVKVGRIRSTMGLLYPTDAASFVLFACMGIVILGTTCPFILSCVLSVVSLLLSCFYFKSTTSTIISGLVCLTVIVAFIYANRAPKLGLPTFICELSQLVLYSMVPFLTVLHLLLAYFYGKEHSWVFRIDEVLHKRVELAYKGLTEHGITLLGKSIDMFGMPAPGINNRSLYNYLDSSYINISVRYGLIALICIMAMWIMIQRKAVRNGNVFIILVTLLISIHSFEEQHFAEIVYNPLLYLPFADGFKNDGNMINSFLFIKKHAKKLSACAIFIGGIALFSPYIFSATRTAYDSMTYENIPERLEADSKAVELILDAKEFPVYADVLTGKYTEKYKGITKSALSGDDLVRRLDCTVITDADNNSPAFFSKGAVYVQISDYSAVYTTDSSVINALRDSGYHVAGYYNREENLGLNYCYSSESISVSSRHVEISGEISVDNRGLSEGGVANVILYAADGTVDKIFNQKDITDAGTISYKLALDTKQDAVSLEIESLGESEIAPISAELTDGTKKIPVGVNLCSMKTVTTKIYEGSYTLKTHLEMVNLGSVSGDIVAKIFLTPEAGTAITKDIYRRDFSVDGTLDYEIVFNSPGDYYSFMIEPVGNAELRADSINIVNTPEYDVLSTYNSNGKISRSEYYDLDGNKTLSKEGVFACEYEYDKYGNAIEIRYYDIDNSPVISSNGYAEVHRKYDRLKHLIYESYYGEDGAPLTNQSGFAAFAQDVDPFGRATFIKYYDGEGNLTMTAYKYAAIRKKYNDDNQVVYEAYYDDNGHRLTMEGGYSGCRYDYDNSGRQNKIFYLNDEDEPTIIKAGYAEIDWEFDDKGNITVESYYDEEGELVLLDGGYSSVVRLYDDYGDNTSILYFGPDTSAGYSEIRREYDDQRRLIYEGKFDDKGEGQILDGEYSAYRLEYDDLGHVNSIKYYGTDGNPILIWGEYFEVKRKYDQNNRVIYESYWGLDGEKVSLSGFYHGLGYSYDDNNNRNVIKYYDTNDEIVAGPTGICEIRRTFDQAKRIITESYYDLNGKAVLNASGYASYKREYDAEGNVSIESHYDLEGNLIDG